ncbi:serine palmitoyltransferase small subunit A [Xyrichtys novacula]|uniref:Serine palmitoyltransferase small subunit A n=1 Tax=Xyrichtys novacula TaxID=13765 RepID=A0AAV1GR39_XYRNO|nr:serine palmitoyltransferase small subunit A [Xyrichtys novacula]
MALGDCWKQLSWFYYQYLLVTALYMLEPWERTVFNSLLISVAGMAVYTGYVFMPQHIMAILHYFEVLVHPPVRLPAPGLEVGIISSHQEAGSCADSRIHTFLTDEGYRRTRSDTFASASSAL